MRRERFRVVRARTLAHAGVRGTLREGNRVYYQGRPYRVAFVNPNTDLIELRELHRSFLHRALRAGGWGGWRN